VSFLVAEMEILYVPTEPESALIFRLAFLSNLSDESSVAGSTARKELTMNTELSTNAEGSDDTKQSKSKLKTAGKKTKPTPQGCWRASRLLKK
jgi:hypothetical protein